MPLPDIKKSTGHAGTLWLYAMPGLTPKILEIAAREMGLMWYGQMVNLHPTQWLEYKQRCAELVGLSPEWEREAYLSAYAKAKQDGWGKRYGPGSPGGWRRKSINEYVEKIQIQESLDVSGTLFET